MKALVIFAFILGAFSCQENSSKEEKKVQLDDYPNTSTPSGYDGAVEDAIKQNKTQEINNISGGTFKKVDDGAKDAACNCNCLEIDFNQPSELCLDNDFNINIQVKYQKANDNDVEVYYVSGKGKIEGEDEIPWEEFDKNTPLAIITQKGKQLELDWKGFTIDGEIATDYAILGRKNLEGEYTKKGK